MPPKRAPSKKQVVQPQIATPTAQHTEETAEEITNAVIEDDYEPNLFNEQEQNEEHNANETDDENEEEEEPNIYKELYNKVQNEIKDLKTNIEGVEKNVNEKINEVRAKYQVLIDKEIEDIKNDKNYNTDKQVKKLKDKTNELDKLEILLNTEIIIKPKSKPKPNKKIKSIDANKEKTKPRNKGLDFISENTLFRAKTKTNCWYAVKIGDKIKRCDENRNLLYTDTYDKNVFDNLNSFCVGNYLPVVRKINAYNELSYFKGNEWVKLINVYYGETI